MNSASATPFDPPEHPAPLLDRTLVRAFLEHVPDIVFFKDADSRFVAVSRSKARRHELRSTPSSFAGSHFCTQSR